MTFAKEKKNSDLLNKLQKAFPNCVIFYKADVEIQKNIESSQGPIILLVTAVWDTSGILNKQAIKDIEPFIKEHKIKCYNADNTKPNDYTSYLFKKYDSVGVPLTILYLSGNEFVLPEIYTKSSLKELISDILDSNNP